MTELFLGIDLGGSHISGGLLDRNGKTSDPFSKIGIDSDLNADHLLNYLASFVRLARLAALTHGNHLIAVGLASPGPLEPNAGIIISPPNLPNIRNLKIVNLLQNMVDLPVFLINDTDAAVLGEAWLGSARGFKNVVMLTLGTGIGSGIIVDGKLQRGRGMGGEWGHTSIYSNETRTCSCGKKNCLEIFCGTEGLARTYCQRMGVKRSDLSPEFVSSISKRMSKLKDIEYKWGDIFETYCRDLTKGVLNIVNVHHPDCIVLGGGIANLSIVESVKVRLDEDVSCKFRALLEGLEIRVSANRFWIIGSAKYAMDCYEVCS